MNEKMRVLELLEGGKITADEAAKLIEALGTSSLMSQQTRDNVEERVNQFAGEVSKFAKDVGCKMQEFYKDVEPKLKKASQTALEKAAATLDNLACNIGESLEKDCCGSEGCCASAEECDAPKPN